MSTVMQEIDDRGWSNLMPPGEPVKGKTYRADGWFYRDVPWTTVANFDRLLGIIGDGHFVVLASTKGNGLTRGQVLVSPEGMARVRGRLVN